MSKLYKKYNDYDPSDNAIGQRSMKSYKSWRKKEISKKLRRQIKKEDTQACL